LDHLFLVESEEQIPKLQLLKKTSLSAPAHTANVLMINDGDLVLQVLRLYCQREEPVILSRSLLPAVTVSNLTKVTKKREFLP
jgi:DNA-binding GntR family transcriptional regulator